MILDSIEHKSVWTTDEALATAMETHRSKVIAFFTKHEEFSQAERSLLRDMLALNPRDRIDIDEVVERSEQLYGEPETADPCVIS